MDKVIKKAVSPAAVIKGFVDHLNHAAQQEEPGSSVELLGMEMTQDGRMIELTLKISVE